MNQSATQGKSKKPYVSPKVKAHGKVYQLTQTGAPADGSPEINGYSPAP